MLIVISDALCVANEAALINQLFGEGLPVFHLRKPGSSAQQIKMLLQEIDIKHYSKIALHDHHYLADDFGITHLHINETNRRQLAATGLPESKAKDVVLSTSIHTIKDYAMLQPDFDYTFLSPVFNSISKAGYKALEENERLLPRQKTGTKLIALGGITADNCRLPLEWGFDGIAVLGALWNDPRQLIKNFKTIQALCATTAP